MKIVKGNIYAVLTGDIVGSSKLTARDRERLYEVMRNGSAELQRFYQSAVPLPVDIFRGDSWQVLLSDPEKSFEAGLFYRTFIKANMKRRGIDTRMSIGIGTIDFLPGNKVSEGDGEAYRISGEGLENLPKFSYMRYTFPNTTHEAALHMIVQLIDVIAQKWSDKQALAVFGTLQGLKQEDITKFWGKPIAQQAIGKHLDRADWRVVKRAADFFETSVSIDLQRV